MKLWCVCGAQGGICLDFRPSLPLCTPNKHTHTKQKSWHAHWDGTKPSLQQRTEPQRGKKPAVLIGIPSSWSTWIQTLSDSELTQGNGKKPGEGESESDREHIFDCGQKADLTSPPPPISIPRLPMWPHFDCKAFLSKPNSTRSHQNKKRRKKEK